MASFTTAIPFIKAAEGRLSRATTDTASRHPAPWPYRGQTGWHTNKGITYSTFVSLAPKLGYAISPENFFLMPEALWQRIFKAGFWDVVKCDQIRSEVLAIALVDYAFNFGPTGAESRIQIWLKKQYRIVAKSPDTVATALNKLSAKDEKGFFQAFIAHRRDAYQKLNQPDNEEGWLERMDKLEEEGLAFLSKNSPALATTAFFFDSHPACLSAEA